MSDIEKRIEKFRDKYYRDTISETDCDTILAVGRLNGVDELKPLLVDAYKALERLKESIDPIHVQAFTAHKAIKAIDERLNK